jgi:hypothetical protein
MLVMAMLRIGITSMRIRNQLFTLIRITDPAFHIMKVKFLLMELETSVSLKSVLCTGVF